MLSRMLGNGWMEVACDGCGAVMTVPEPMRGPTYDMLMGMAMHILCDPCKERVARAEQDAATEQRRTELAASVAMRMRRMGVPDGMAELAKAPNAALGEWMWQRRTKHMVIGGQSGVGKTTAAVAAMHCMAARRELNARYCLLSQLSAEYVAALRGERGGDETFWWRLSRLHVLVIDEMVGRGGFGKLAPASQELVSGIVDRAYSGAMTGAVWMLGNFCKGSWEEMLDEPEAVRRRIREKFLSVWVETGSVREVSV